MDGYLEADIIKDERDVLLKQHYERIEIIRKRIDAGGLSNEEKELLRDLNFETNYDKRSGVEYDL